MAAAVDTESAELLRGLFLLIETKGLVTETQKAQFVYFFDDLSFAIFDY